MFSFGKKKKTNKPAPNPAANVLSKGMVTVKDLVAPSFVEVDFNHIKIDEFKKRFQDKNFILIVIR